MQNVTAVGPDLAKTVFQVHGADEYGRAALRKALRRGQAAEFFAQLPACVVGMEAVRKRAALGAQAAQSGR